MSKLTELLEQAGKAQALRRAGCYTAHPPDYLDDFGFETGFSLAPWLSTNPEILCLLNAGTNGVRHHAQFSLHFSMQKNGTIPNFSSNSFPFIKVQVTITWFDTQRKICSNKTFPGDCFNQVAIAVSPWEARL